MNTNAKLLVGLLVAAVAVLSITVGVLAAGGGMGSEAADGMMGANGAGANGASQGMMGEMGSMDDSAMLAHMRDVLGEDGYQRMLAHMRDGQNGTPAAGAAGSDSMMHAMMGGMMQDMPMSSGTPVPPVSDEQDRSPTPATPQP